MAFSFINNKKNLIMSNKLKYLKYFSSYINEQAFPNEEGAAVTAPKELKFSFIFIDQNYKGHYNFPDGSSSRQYNTYEITKPELDQWANSNVISSTDDNSTKSSIDVSRKSVIEFISGIKSSVSPNDKKYIKKFKNAVVTEIIGTQIQDTDVIFSAKENKPTTDSLDVTFIMIDFK